MTERRDVRVLASFFEDLDRQLSPERGPAGEPSSIDFQAAELMEIVERFATGFASIARLEEPPEGAVTMTMRCGDDCSGTVDVTDLLNQQSSGEWGTVAVRLRCFEDAGVDMSRLGVPFAVATDGSLGLRFSDVRLVPAEESLGGCPAVAADPTAAG